LRAEGDNRCDCVADPPLKGIQFSRGRSVMSLRNFSSTIFGRVLTSRRNPRRRPFRRLNLERLDDRVLPSCTVTLAASDEAPLVGERVTWTATAADCGATPVYQFSAAPHGDALHVVRDFSPTNNFAWTPMQEGAYDIEVTVKDGYQAAETTSAVATD